MTPRTHIKSIHVKKLAPLTNKEFHLNFNEGEVLILGGNGGGKTSFLRLIQSLTTLDFNELFQKSCSFSEEREIDIQYTAQIKDQLLKFSIMESVTKTNDVFDESSISDLFGNGVKEKSLISKRILKLNSTSSESNTSIDILIDDKNCLFKVNNSVIYDGTTLEFVRHGDTNHFTIRDIGLNFLRFSKKTNFYSPKLLSDLVDLFLFLEDQPESFSQIFTEDKNNFDLLVKNSSIHYSRDKNSNSSALVIGPWYLGGPHATVMTKKENDWLLNRLDECHKSDIPFFTAQGTDLTYLQNIAGELKIEDIKFNIFLKSKQNKEDGSTESVWVLKNITIIDKLKNEYDSENLSYGQKRYLSLMIFIRRTLSYQALLIDEPTNGLHHKFIENFYYRDDKASQTFMTTQSPWLLNFIEAKTEKELASKFIICKKEHGFFSWRNLTKTEIKSIVKSQEHGIERMDEILQSKGVW